MKFNRLAIPVLGFAIGLSGVAMAQPSAVPQEPPPPGYGPGGWDAPPNEFSEVQRRGFHDGIEGARKDYDNHRPPTPENREEYRHPPVQHEFRHDYREAFRRGYMVGVQHMGGR